MSTNEKRHKRIFTHKEKMMAIQRINDGETKAAVSRDLNVAESTLRGWCKNEDKLRYMMKRLSSAKAEETSDVQPPEKRLRTKSPVVPIESNDNEFKNPIAHHQPQTNEAYTPIEMITKRSLHSPPLSHLQHPDPGTGVSMSATIPFSEPHPQPVNKTPNVLSVSEISTIMNFLSHPYGMSTYSATPRSICGLQSPSPAQCGMLEPKLPIHAPQISPLPPPYFKTPLYDETIQNYKQIMGQTPHLRNNHDTPLSVSKTKQTENGLNSYVRKDINTKDSSHGNKYETIETQTNEQTTFLPKQVDKHAKTIDTKTNKPKEVRTQAKISSVLDNLLLNNGNLKINEPESNDTCIAGGPNDPATVEALENGEKFLAWLEICGDPRVTHMHVHQLRGLLNNLRRRAAEPTTTDAARQN